MNSGRPRKPAFARPALRIACAVLGLCGVLHASAAVRASLDRDHIALGQTITLTLSSDRSSAKPELAPLQKDFELLGESTGSQTTIINGAMQSSQQWSVTMTPRHAGLIEIPPLTVGTESTNLLRVQVDAAPTASGAMATTPGQAGAAPVHAGKPGDPAFVVGSVAQTDPYVGQAVVYTLRLYYAVNLFGGSLDLPAGDNGDLRQIGPDQRDSAVVDGRNYVVIERHYLLVPEHSGSAHIPAPVFQGQAIVDPTQDPGNAFDDAFVGMGGLRTLRATGRAIALTVRARPAQAGEPWLPAQSVGWVVDAPTTAPRAGEPFELVLHETADGVAATQLPEIELPAIPGAQVYPEPSTTTQALTGDTLHAERTRRFAIVPAQAGTLQLPVLSLPWWDVVHDRSQVAQTRLPLLQVQPGAGTVPAGPPTTGVAPAPASAPMAAHARGELQPNPMLRWWQGAAAVLALILVLTLAWGRRRPRDEEASPISGADAPVLPKLDAALALGDVALVVRILRESAPSPRPRDLDALQQRLADPAQRTALKACESSRWSADGQPSAQALAALRAAFAKRPRWLDPAGAQAAREGLPPLYPD